jgi:hypothetical protein
MAVVLWQKSGAHVGEAVVPSTAVYQGAFGIVVQNQSVCRTRFIGTEVPIMISSYLMIPLNND